MPEWFPLIILNTIHQKVFIFHTVNDHNQWISPIDFWDTGSKVKVTRALNVRLISAYYLENNLSQSFYVSHTDWP
jgi:hypothetical protein